MIRLDTHVVVWLFTVAGGALVTKDRTIHDHTTIALW